MKMKPHILALLGSVSLVAGAFAQLASPTPGAQQQAASAAVASGPKVRGGGQVLTGDVPKTEKPASVLTSAVVGSEPKATGGGQVSVGDVPKTEKPVINFPQAGAPNVKALGAVIYDAWFSNQTDTDGDGYPRSFRLNWDVDVANGSGSLSVFDKASASSSWTLFNTTAAHTITDSSTAERWTT